MTTQVQTSGFITQPITSAPIQGGAPNIPPHGMQPGFTQQQPTQVSATTTASVAEPAAEPAVAGTVDASIAALLAALQAQAPKVEAEPAAAEPVTGSLNSFDVATLEDPILRSMATVMQTVGKGIDMDRALGLAIERGDPSLIDAAYLREKGGANAEQLVTIAKGIVQAVEAQSLTITQGVHALAGSEQNWNTSVAAFNKAAPPHLRQVVAMMLDSKNRSQIDAGAKLVVEYAKQSGLVPNARPLIQNDGGAVSAAQALTKEAFQEELRKLNPNSKTFGSEREALFARRQMGRQLQM